MASDILTGRYLISTPLDCDSIECSNLIPGSPSYRASKYYPRTEVSLSLTGHSPSSLNISEFSSTINHIDAFYFTTHLCILNLWRHAQAKAIVIAKVGCVVHQLETGQERMRITDVDMVNPSTSCVSGTSYKLLEAKVTKGCGKETVGVLV